MLKLFFGLILIYIGFLSWREMLKPRTPTNEPVRWWEWVVLVMALWVAPLVGVVLVISCVV